MNSEYGNFQQDSVFIGVPAHIVRVQIRVASADLGILNMYNLGFKEPSGVAAGSLISEQPIRRRPLRLARSIESVSFQVSCD